MPKDIQRINAFADAGKAENSAVNPVSHASSLGSVEEYNYFVDRKRGHDASMKALLRNARFTGALLRQILKELKGVTLDDFCRYTGADVLTGSSLGDQATEVGSTYTKEIRLDMVFEYDAYTKLLLRINQEPQTTQQSFHEERPDSYSLVGRAMYYASLAMVTELKSKEEYHNIRKVYSVWICYKRPIPELREPVVSYSMRPDRDYKYKDGTPLSECKRKFDNGDLISVVLVSVPDVEAFYKHDSLKYNGQYEPETIDILYKLLSDELLGVQRKQFYYDEEIIVRGSEEGNSVSVIEEVRQELTEIYKAEAAEMRQEATEMKQEATEMKQEATEMKQEATEMKQEATEMKQEATEMKQEATEMKQEATEMKQEATEMKQEAKEMIQEAAEIKQKAAEIRQEAEKMIQEATETKREAVETERKAAETERKAAETKILATISSVKNISLKFNLPVSAQIESIAEQLKVSIEKASELYYKESAVQK